MAIDRPGNQPTFDQVNDLEKMLRRAGLPELSPELIPKLKAITVDTVATLRTITGDLAGNRGPRCCILNATATPGDGGFGLFYWHDTLQGANGAAFDDNGVNYVQVMGQNGQFQTPGAWVRAKLTIPPDVQTFSANGTWTKPTTGTPTWVRVELIPWGASGAGGTTGGGAGGGGGASGVSTWEGPASLLGATEAVTFGAQPLGGAIATNGTDAPDATFGAWLAARGGKKGTAAGVGGAGGYGNAGTGGAGGNAATGGGVGTGKAGGGGGGGGNGGAGAAGGNGGPDRAVNLPGGAGGTVASPGNPGAPGSSASANELSGGGGGGGGGTGNFNANGGAGGAGGSYGAGGGGGAVNGGGASVAGVGGPGGQCFARVVTWFT